MFFTVVSDIDKGSENPAEDDWFNNELNDDKSDQDDASQGIEDKSSDFDEKGNADGRNVQDPVQEDDRKINGETSDYYNEECLLVLF